MSALPRQGVDTGEAASLPPCAELHVHLEGAFTARRARELAAGPEGEFAGPPPVGALVRDGDNERWGFGSFHEFLEAFGWSTRLLRTPEAYGAVLEDLLESFAAQHVVRAEVFVAIGQMHRARIEPGSILPELARRAREREQAGGPSVWFIADATRNWGVTAAEAVLDAALALQSHRIVGFGVGGDETSLPARSLKALFRRAAENGLGLSCHAGEGTTAVAVRATVEELEVRRVGHGIAAADDERLMRELRQEGVVLEVCPTSNEKTGVWDPRRPHPLLRLLEHGVPVVLGSDDPAFFATTLRSEFARVAAWGIDAGQLDAMRKRALEAGFTR